MSQKQKVLLFGASIAGQRALQRVYRRAEVIGFVDNDPLKKGGRLGRHRIYSPETIPSLPYDYIVISSMYVAEIHTQLMKMGVPPEKVVSFFQSEQAETAFPWDAVLFLGLMALALGAAVAAWLL